MSDSIITYYFLLFLIISYYFLLFLIVNSFLSYQLTSINCNLNHDIP